MLKLKNKNFHNEIRQTFKTIDVRVIINLCLWIVFTTIVIAFAVLFVNERSSAMNLQHAMVTIEGRNYATINQIKEAISNGTINNQSELIKAYNSMNDWTTGNFPLIDFSLMLFVNGKSKPPQTDPASAWTIRSNAISIAYSYMFITAMIALIALAMQVYVNARMLWQRHLENKLKLSTTFPTSSLNYMLFRTQMYVDFVNNLALVFAFFNFTSMLIVIGYWIFSYIINKITRLFMHGSKSLNEYFNQNRSSFYYLIFVMIFQIIYTVLKAYFLNQWGVNLDLILQIILPIGTITVIVGLFIRNMLNSKINGVLSAIKTIDSSVSTFRTFYYTNKTEALNDFNFVNVLPPMIKNPLTSGNINKQEADTLMHTLDEAVTFVEQHYQDKPRERSYILYNLFKNVTQVQQIEEIKDNTLKIESYHQGKHIRK